MPIRRSVELPTRKTLRVGRNQPCPCGSERKYKDCHQPEGEAFLLKLLRDQERERVEAEQKAAGVPWIKRWLNRMINQ